MRCMRPVSQREKSAKGPDERLRVESRAHDTPVSPPALQILRSDVGTPHQDATRRPIGLDPGLVIPATDDLLHHLCAVRIEPRRSP